MLGAGAVVLNCVISGNFDVERGGGVWGKDASLIGCSIRFNDADQSSAIHGFSGSPMYIADTTICTNWGSTFQIGVAFIDGGGNTIVDECPAECPVQECQADLSGNGSVDVPDLLKLLANWGACSVP